jgi:SAM-dependent methyltransferase
LIADAATEEPHMNQSSPSYLLAGQPSEIERLQLQSRVWEPAGRSLLAELPSGASHVALDVGCGVMGWLRILSDWVGETGSVVGSDVDETMLANARFLIEGERLRNVRLQKDDLFASHLAPRSFDLVHARFQIAPLGRGPEQVAAYQRLLRPGGRLVLEEPDLGSWLVHPDASGVARLIDLIQQGFLAAGGDFNAGRALPGLLRSVGLVPHVTAKIVALEPGHPYLRLPLQFATSLRARLEALVTPVALAALVAQAEHELSRPGTWGTTFTLIQVTTTMPDAKGK